MKSKIVQQLLKLLMASLIAGGIAFLTAFFEGLKGLDTSEVTSFLVPAVVARLYL